MSNSSASVLILFAHPALEKSRVNRALMEAVRDLDGVTFHDLYQQYPDFHIDVDREQSLLRQHRSVVFQHPLYWYSCPALVKEWVDLVLEYGFAYGEGGDVLDGKHWLSAISTAGTLRAYCEKGSNQYTIREFLRPFEQSALLCNMRWLPPYVVHNSQQISDPELDRAAENYRRLIERLRDRPDVSVPAGQHSYINKWLEQEPAGGN